VARALVDIGRAVGHDVRRPDLDADVPADLGALVVASHGRDEEPVLAAAIRANVPYIGLVASRKRGQAVLASLDVTDEQRARVHTPAGLDIGARTPAEVAVSVYAELISTRSPLPAPTSVVLAAEAVDPVCGMTVAVSETALSYVDNGLTVYFCGPGCRQAYADDPERY
jgi:xanthine dehydrogenase accessory factor